MDLVMFFRVKEDCVQLVAVEFFYFKYVFDRFRVF